MNYEAELNNLRAAQTRAATANLENTRNQALSDLQAEQMKNTATFGAQRSTANAQNRMSARNFQEYLASTGRANSGLSAQARMQNANNLSTSLNTLNAGEAAALADINRRTTDTNNAYNTGLASASANIEADYIKNLLDQREKALARDLQERQFQEAVRARELQEKQFQESIRQFNENLAFQREQLQSRFNSGSGGGGGSTRGTTSKKVKGNNNTSAGGVSDADKYGVFSNGYQPKGIGGYGAVSKTGDTIKIGNKTQNVWKTPDGTRWYWDGSSRKYVAMRAVSSGGGRHG